MLEQPRPPWIEVWPFTGRGVTVVDTGVQVELNPDLQQFVDASWAPKAENGWQSSYVAFMHEMTFAQEQVTVSAGAMQFHQIDGMNKAIEAGLPFAPQLGWVNCLSVGFPTATRDGFVIFQRRAQDVHVPNTLIHEPCGYMSSMMMVPKGEVADPKYAHDSRLYSLKAQLDARRFQIATTFGVDPEYVSYQEVQHLLGADWLATEAYFSTVGKIGVDRKHLTLPPRGEFVFVPFDKLEQLILNQANLIGVDRASYRPDIDSVTEMPLIGESLVGLVWGLVDITGHRIIDIPDTVARLNEGGLNITIHDTSPGQTYDFPTSF